MQYVRCSAVWMSARSARACVQTRLDVRGTATVPALRAIDRDRARHVARHMHAHSRRAHPWPQHTRAALSSHIERSLCAARSAVSPPFEIHHFSQRAHTHRRRPASAHICTGHVSYDIRRLYTKRLRILPDDFVNQKCLVNQSERNICLFSLCQEKSSVNENNKKKKTH